VLGVAPEGRAIGVGRAPLRSLAGVDRGLAIRVHDRACLLMPHGGVAIVRELIDACARAGLAPGGEAEGDVALAYPEARSLIEARALHALSRAPSPLAIDLLLAQHELWSRVGLENDPARDAILGRLLRPPLVVALGEPNIGKSTLLNALAQRDVSIVADEAGTTRDHVGAAINFAGLVVHYVDTPGLRSGAHAGFTPGGSGLASSAGEIEREAVSASLALAASADLILLCEDAPSDAGCAAADAGLSRLPPAVASRPALRVALRCDRVRDASSAGQAPDLVRVSAHTGAGIGELVAMVKGRLLPGWVLADERPWKFWEGASGACD
jgi:hypothetical protein